MPTPFPRANHVVQLRRERTVRLNRRLIGIAVGLGIAASGGVAVAAAVPQHERTVAVAKDDPATAALAQSALQRAETALDEAHDDVDTAPLEKRVDELSDYERMPAVVVRGEAEETDEVREEIVAETAALEEADAEAQREAEEAARKAEEERKAAEALAAANSPSGAQATAQAMAAERFGWGADQFGCLVSLWNKESGWNYQASNPSSGAYGIPQSLPGSKMATVGSDWETNATTQISWGLDYISRSYGTPCAAWGHSQATNWY
ncbi:aggregation-promoting factor C-terminal-like domain-containing protein [Microbacterium rhizophilus]|uniref:aggregation-promoting factor C-terminal-like domain-containing protein n=1 Tax=Microbacterium rhizophilus TaxID=3138934 RepID=UPI0031EE8519